jgi:hypothetical protein
MTSNQHLNVGFGGIVKIGKATYRRIPVGPGVVRYIVLPT